METVHAALEKAIAPMHGQKRLTGTHVVVAADRHNHLAAPAFQADKVAWFQVMLAQLLRMQAQDRFAHVAEQLRSGAGADSCHAIDHASDR